MLAAMQPLASKWLQVFPNAQVGTTLTNSTFRVNVALRLGEELCADHVCSRCGKAIGKLGAHSLSCLRCQGRYPRHHAFNEEIWRAFGRPISHRAGNPQVFS